MYIKKVTNSATPVTAVVVDNLTSDSSTDALSAKQGKILNEKIENINVTGGTGAPEIAVQEEEPTGQEVLWIEENNDIIDLDIEDTISIMVDDKLSELFVDGEIVMDYTVEVETDQIEFTALNLTPEYKYDITIEGSSSQGGDIMVRVNGITYSTYHSMGSYYNNSDTANADYQYNNGIRHNIDHWYYGFSLYSTPTKLNATLELIKDLNTSVYLPVATWQSFSCWNGVGFRSDVKGTCTEPVSNITKLTFTLFDGNYVPGTRFIIKKYRKLI